MIEIKNVYTYNSYKNFAGPFFIFFFKKEGNTFKDISNLSFIKYLRSIEEIFCDLPLLGYDYLKFMHYIKEGKVSSCNDVIVISKY